MLFCYGDDTAAHRAARDVEYAQVKLNRVRRVVNVCIVDDVLLLALNTENVVFTKVRTPSILFLHVGASGGDEADC